MKLSDIIQKTKKNLIVTSKINHNIEINNVSYDSRNIQPGDIFVAIKGFQADGHSFIEEAIKKGAVAIVSQDEVEISKNISLIRVKNTRKYLAEIACIINRNPAKLLTMIGITGTNGKTTTSYILEQIIKEAKYNSGIIGTINYRFNAFKKTQLSTTPESVELQNILRTMLASKVTHVILEVSSHALSLDRIYNCAFDVAIFTNLSQDHLDYHQSIEKYWHVKQKLFHSHLKKKAVAVINIDDIRGKSLSKSLSKKIKVISTSITKASDVWASSFSYDSKGTVGTIKTPNGSFSFQSPLIGDFNLNNILSATGAGIAIGISPTDICAGINATSRIPGRLDLLDNSSGISVYIDYAHTPDALDKVLTTLHSLKRGHVITVFGCGGNRDSSKRAVMGKIAMQLSDLVIVTSDNPRYENQAHINEQIIMGIKEVCSNTFNLKSLLPNKWKEKSYTVISDRKEAISIAIRTARANDIVLIAGKGHEKYQIIGHKALDFDDKKEAEKALLIPKRKLKS